MTAIASIEAAPIAVLTAVDVTLSGAVKGRCTVSGLERRGCAGTTTVNRSDAMSRSTPRLRAPQGSPLRPPTVITPSTWP